MKDSKPVGVVLLVCCPCVRLPLLTTLPSSTPTWSRLGQIQEKRSLVQSPSVPALPPHCHLNPSMGFTDIPQSQGKIERAGWSLTSLTLTMGTSEEGLQGEEEELTERPLCCRRSCALGRSGTPLPTSGVPTASGLSFHGEACL